MEKQFASDELVNTMFEIIKQNAKSSKEQKEENKIVGLVVGLINNDVEETYEFKAPKRGRISELIVSKNIRSKGIGSELLHKMEKYLKENGCEKILIGVFAYNDKAINFYEKNGYHTRMIDMIN